MPVPILWKIPFKERRFIEKISIGILILGFCIGTRLILNTYIVLAIGILITAYLIFSRPLYGLILLIGFDLVYGFFSRNLILLGLVVSSLITLLLISIIKRGKILSPSEKIRTPVDIPVFSILMITIIYAFIGILRSNELILIGGDFFNLTKFCILFFITINVINNINKIKEFILAFLALTSIFSAVILFLYLTGLINDLTSTMSILFAKTEFIRLGFVSGFPSFHLILVLCITSYSQQRKIKIWAGITTLIIFIILLLTLKRTYWASFVLSFIFIFIFSGYREKIKIIKILLWGGLLLLILTVMYFGLLKSQDISLYKETISNRIKSISDPDEPSIVNRFREYNDALTVITHNPWGFGLGSKSEAFSVKQHKVADKHYFHNSYIFYALQIGVFGVFIIILTFIILLKELIKIQKGLEDKWLKGIMLGLTGGSLNLMLNAFAVRSLTNIYIAISMGIVFVIIKIVKDQHQTPKVFQAH